MVVQRPSSSGCVTFKKLRPGNYTFLTSPNGDSVYMTTYCPTSKCRRLGLSSIYFSGQRGSVAIKFSSDKGWNQTVIRASYNIVESSSGKSLIIKNKIFKAVIKRRMKTKMDKYVILFTLKDSQPYKGLVEFVHNLKNKNAQKYTTSKQRRIQRVCLKTKSDYFGMISRREAQKYAL